jgi:hypothetical protein
MILNSYAVLLVSLDLLRLIAAMLIIALGVRGWGASRRVLNEHHRAVLEDRSYLMLAMCLFILVLSAASWPLLYLLLNSYVAQWPGVMCIYGVTQVGKGSLGAARFLPGLVTALQIAKPAMALAGGAWFVLYLLNRRTPSAPLLGRLFLCALPLAALVAADAVAELTYVVIPKTEEFPSAGCCTACFEDSLQRFTPSGIVDETDVPWLHRAYYGCNLALILALVVASRPRARLPGPLELALLFAAGIVVLLTSGTFLIDVVAPTLLHLPYHHCPYDLISAAPEAIVATALHLGGFLALGWAGAARCFGASPETSSLLGGTVQRLLRLSLWCYAASLVMIAVELALA